MKVFFATPYTQLCDENNMLKEDYKNFFTKLVEEAKKLEIEYFLALEREEWGKNYICADESTNIDYNAILDSDVVCIIPGIPHSGGVHVEIGWASSNKKKMHIFLNKNCSYSPMVTGLKSLTDANFYYYESEFSDELIDAIIKSIMDIKG